jgi:hypothetical protein
MTTFTAKWVYKDYVSGAQCERLINASGGVHVAYDDRTPDRKINESKLMLGIYTIPTSGGVVVIGENVDDGGNSMALAFGTVYIMNDAGKTVAKYYLSETPDWVYPERNAKDIG